MSIFQSDKIFWLFIDKRQKSISLFLSFFLERLVDFDKSGYIKTDDDIRKNTAGMYAVGDVRSKKVRQIDVAKGK
ncbi:MAG: hypothetical protein ACTSYG_10765 [Candidatus Heimdallarchaeota archaeon]